MYHIEVDTRTRVLKLFKDGTFVKKYPVAVGKPSTPTPLGNWIITNKGLWGGPVRRTFHAAFSTMGYIWNPRN